MNHQYENFLDASCLRTACCKLMAMHSKCLFLDVMKSRVSSFQKVKPYGNIGDKKNDSFIPESGEFFALYGPEDINKEATVDYAKSKIKTDVTGLVNNWQNSYEIKAVYFTINDKGYGAPPQVYQVISQLQKDFEGIYIQLLTYDDIVVFSENLT